MSMTCPTCNVKLVRKSKSSKKLRCPKCDFTMNYVALEAEASKDRTDDSAAIAPVISLADSPEEGIAETQEKRKKKLESNDAIPIPEYTSVVCPTCGTRVHPRVRKKEYTVKCPDCFVQVRVPPLADVMEKLKDQALAAPLGDFGNYEFQMPTEIGPSANSMPSTEHLAAQAAVHQELEAPPPRWTFISGVFIFPWRRDAVVQWLGMSLCWCIFMGVLIGSVLPFLKSGSFGGMGEAIILVCLSVLGVLVGSWGVSYAAAAMLSVITDTASGNDRVTAWPDFQFMEWLSSLIQVVYAATFSMIIAWAVAVTIALVFDSTAIAVLVTLHLGFPIVLLSTLEAESRWMPLTETIALSVPKNWFGWLQFYFFSGATFASTVAIDEFLIATLPIIRPVFLGPAISAVVLIYGRMLGRLAWLASNPEKGKKKKKSKKRKKKKATQDRKSQTANEQG